MKENNLKIIFHIDMNAFFCSVACILMPELRGIPFAIGREGTSRGVLSTASYEARAYGIHSAMPTIEAKRILPTLRVVHIDYKYYQKYHNYFLSIIREYSSLVEVASIDECYADMTEACKNRHPIVLAKEIQARILKQYDLPCSIGISHTLFLAKMASDMKKPLGVTIITPSNTRHLLGPLSVEDIYGIGKRTSPILLKAGINTIDDFMNPKNKDKVISLVGSNTYQYVRSHVLGLSSDVVDPNRYSKSKSISTSQTYDVYKESLSDMLYEMRQMTRSVIARMKEESSFCKTVTITLRDSDFNTITRQTKLEDFSDDFDLIYNVVSELAEENIEKDKSYRLLGVGLSGLVEKDSLPKEYNIFNVDDVMKKEIILDEMIHEFQNKYGKMALYRKKEKQG